MASCLSPSIEGKAEKLEGEGWISYEIIGGDAGLQLKIVGNTKDGTYSVKSVPLRCLVHCAASNGGTFTSEQIKVAIGSGNKDDAGFLIAVLIDIGVAEKSRKRGRYHLVGTPED